MFPFPLQRNFSLRAYNTFGVEAHARAFLRVTDVGLLQAVRRDPELSILPRLILGGGSNLLLTRDFPGLVLHMCNTGIEITGSDAIGTYVRAAAGERWHRLVLWTLEHGLGGLENLSLIPGSVGAAPIQNIGAYGVEAGDYLHSVTIFDFDSGAVSVLERDACAFGYRDSVFKHALRKKAVILDVTFLLPHVWRPQTGYADVARALAADRSGPEAAVTAAVTAPTAITPPAATAATPTASDISKVVIAIRQAKLPDPAQIGNAGSFFKNPVVPASQRDALLAQFPDLVSYPQADGSYKLAAGWMIDQCGWKGRQLGAAGVYPRQALVLTNLGGATGADIVALAQAIAADVQARFGVALQPEPVYI